ncbi:MAG: hypothetical protein JWP59_1310 [Massilia sp.]|nr:hypothetical protein [Massilia sp.]
MQQNTKRLAGTVVKALVVLAAGWLIKERSAATHAAGWVAAGWVLSAIVVVKLALLLRKAVRVGRQHAAKGVSLASMDAAATASMAPWMQGWYAMEKRAYRYSWRVLTGAPVQAAGPFGVAGGVNSGKRTVSLLMSATLCTAAIGYSLPRYFSPLWPLVGAYAALLAAFLYALVWIVGERRSLKEGGHRIAGGALLLDVGLRASASIDLSSIAACVAIGGRARRDHVWRFSPGEKTNVALEIDRPFHAVVLGTPRTLPAGRVVLYADDPASFVAAVNRAVIAARLAGGPPTAALAGLD